MRLPGLSGFLAPITAAALLGCGGDDLVLPTDETPSSRLPAALEITSGNGQEGIAGSALPQQLVVQVVDEDGAGLAGQTVSWSVATGEGSVTPTSVTNSEGFAAAAWTLGDPGPNTLTATVPDLGSVTFLAIANPSSGGGGGDGDGGGGNEAVPSASTSTVSADPASIQVGSGVSSLRVTVRDAAGAPVPGVVVTLSATGSGNTLVQPAGPTGTDGVAVGLLSSSIAGTKDVTATINGTLQIGQTARVSVTGAPANRVEMVDGNNQQAESGTQVAVAPAVRVTNSFGEPISGVAVTFVVTRGGGDVSGAAQTTDAQGVARVGSWTLGAEGRNTLEARAGSLAGSPVVFEATATAPPEPPPLAEPHHFEFRVQPHDVRVGEWLTVQVAILDASGNVVPLDGTEIYLGLWEEGDDKPSNDDLAGDRFEDTVNGVATFNLYVTKDGTYRFMARSDYLPKHLGPYGPELFSNWFEVR